MRWGRLEVAPPLVMAPLAGWTDLAWRLVVKSFGAGLVYTEMVSAVGLVRGEARSWALARTHPAEGPTVVQIFGSRPEVLAEAAARLEAAGAQAVDINLGCPVKKVVRQGAGAALLQDLGRVRDIFRRVRAATALPLSAKLRSGWAASDGPVAVAVARLAEAEGLDGLALHPRHARQGFAGRADWSLLAQAAAAVRIPLLGSGDVTTAEEAGRMLSETGCAGVMLGRGALGRPWLFEDAARRLAGEPVVERGPAEVEEVMLRHLNLLRHYEGEVAAGLTFKGWASRYLRGLPGAKELRRALFAAPDARSMLDLLAEYFGRLKDEERG